MIPAVGFELGLQAPALLSVRTKRHCAVLMSLEYAMRRFLHFGRIKGRLGLNTRQRSVRHSTSRDHEKSRYEYSQ